MILLDANLLIYGHVEKMPEHAAARRWLEDRMNGTARVGFPWQSLLAFLRVVTNTRLFERAVGIRDAWRQVEDWLACDIAWVPQPTDRHAAIFGNLLASGRIHGNLVHDAHLAALAIEHGLELCSTDGDFARFPELRWTNPIR